METSGSAPRLWAFFLLAFAWSWRCWLLSPAVKPDSPSLATVFMYAGSFGASMAAVLVVANAGGRAGLRAWLVRCLRWPMGWQHGWRWMALALVLPVALTALAATLHIALGGSVGPSPAAGHVLMTLVNIPLVFLLGGPLGEELGWRGFALPNLQERFDWRVASLSLGLV